MDNRIEKTKRSIYDAFISLREKKPLEKLTVKELCEAADINKSTFYVYYRDVYDLSDKIEDEIVTEVLKSLDNTDMILSNSAEFSKALFRAYSRQTDLIASVFSGMRAEQLPRKIEASLKKTVFALYPEYADNIDFNIRLTYSIYGGFYTYLKFRDSRYEEVVEVIGELSEKVMK
ncbi:MAG: TetR/AcrR family transcriptional regulator [Oscillospiraceae bacterium]|nr:TetR/AcrR family transcriptional regulator [Oscillospiraceae bacterium]